MLKIWTPWPAEISISDDFPFVGHHAVQCFIFIITITCIIIIVHFFHNTRMPASIETVPELRLSNRMFH